MNPKLQKSFQVHTYFTRIERKKTSLFHPNMFSQSTISTMSRPCLWICGTFTRLEIYMTQAFSSVAEAPYSQFISRAPMGGAPQVYRRKWNGQDADKRPQRVVHYQKGGCSGGNHCFQCDSRLIGTVVYRKDMVKADTLNIKWLYHYTNMS